MAIKAEGWFAQAGGGPLRSDVLEIPDPAQGEVVLEVAACGLCHTDLGYASGKVTPKHPLPLVLGHEIVGQVVATGPGAEGWRDARVLVPAVLPCGDCAFCKAGRGNACPQQKMPGNDIHGGFATHVKVPAAPLVRLDPSFEGAAFRALGVVADAVSTAYQAVRRAGLERGDLAVVVGAGGVGSFLVQIAHALGAHVVALDVREDRLKLAAEHGAERTLRVEGDDPKALRKSLQEVAKAHGIPSLRHRVFECSGTAPGQLTAFGLLGQGGTVTFVGYTIDKVQVRLSNLMAFDATALGTWGCPPQLYGEVLDLIRRGAVKLDAFIEEAPLSRINDFMQAMAEHRLERRMVLVPRS